MVSCIECRCCGCCCEGGVGGRVKGAGVVGSGKPCLATEATVRITVVAAVGPELEMVFNEGNVGGGDFKLITTESDVDA